jgi:pimeloyl-ACP methyl ester carboxylesterase
VSPAAAGALDGCVPRGEARVVRRGATTALVLGGGARGVVLSNQSDEQLCAWLPEARKLASQGYRVALYDYPGTVRSADAIAAVVTALRKLGDAHVCLVGASKGAKASVVAATRIRPPVACVVALSAEAGSAEYGDIEPFATRLRVPALYITATDDPYDSGPASSDFAGSQPGHRGRLLKVPGDDHGTALLAGAQAVRVQDAINTFLRGHLP